MALHEQAVGATSEWYTPHHVFAAMGVRFDLDVASPARECPADDFCNDAFSSGGLELAWSGFVWMNPPFGGRNALLPWLERFFAHGNGVALVPDRTSAPWWQIYAPKADALLFVAPKLKFIDANGEPGTSPAQGTTLMALGERGVDALQTAAARGLGALFAPIRNPEPV